MGSVYSIWTQMFPPNTKYFAKDVPDQSGKIIIVTGGNAGIGKETCKILLERNAKVYLAARSREKVEAAIKELKEQTGRNAIFLPLDLANLDSIRRAAEEFKQKESSLHILFNNAGVMIPPVEQLTSDGYDLQFGTNALGHYFFTTLLLPTLLATAKRTPGGQVRVITTSSLGHIGVGGIKWDTLKDSPTRRKTATASLYSQSKLGNVLFAKELTRRYADQGIISISLHPGNLKTDLQRHSSGLLKFLIELMLYEASLGALTQLFAGTAPEAAQLNGEYLFPWARSGKASKAAEDPKLASELWSWFEEQVKGH